MNNSSDFMNYLHEDKIQRLRQDAQPDYRNSRLMHNVVSSPFARVRSAVSAWVAGSKHRDINQS